MAKYIKLESSNGQIVADSSGEVQQQLSSFKPEKPEHMPRLLDVAEWKRFYPCEDPFEYEWDILDWGYWTAEGQYEAPQRNRA